MAVNSSSVLSQTGSEGDLKTFQLSTLVDLSELQQAFSEILTAQLEQSGSCEKRVSLRQASIMGASPASSAVLRLHFERWSCRSAGQGGPMEIAEGDGTVELRLTPVVDKSESLSIASEIRRVDAVGMLEGELKSGDMGSDLREKVAAAILTAANAGLDAKTTLPAALQGRSTLRGAHFEERAASGLNLMVDRELQLSSTQLTALTTQLNQAASEAPRQAKNP